MKRCLLYARISSDDRDRDGASLASQLATCRAYAEKCGYLVVAELSEDERGVSGARLDAPELNRALELADAGEYDVLVCREMDRLARSMGKQFYIEDRLKSLGVGIDYALEQYGDTPEERMRQGFRALLAEYERLKIVQRTERGRRESVKRGNVVTAGQPPYGYREDIIGGKRTLIVEEREACVVRQIFEWYAHGDGKRTRLSTAAIARKLSALGVPTAVDRGTNRATKRRARGRWSASTVLKMLKSGVYAGVWTYDGSDGESIPVEVEALVDADTFALAQRRIKENRWDVGRRPKHPYLLRGRVTCGRCGYTMMAHSTVSRLKSGRTVYRYYSCPGVYHPDRAIDCDMPTLKADGFEDAVWSLVLALFSEPGALDDAHKRWLAEQRDTSPSKRLEALDDAIARVEARLERLLEVYLDGGAGRDLYRKKREEAERELAGLRLERQRALVDAEPDAAAFLSLLEFADAVKDELATVTDIKERAWYADTLDVRVVVEDGDGGRRGRVAAHGVPLGFVEIA